MDCSDSEDSYQGILDWLGVFHDVGVNMVALEYLTEGDNDGVSDVSDSSEEDLTLEAKEFSMIRLSNHATFQSYVEKVMRLSQVVNGDISQERQIHWFVTGMEDRYKIADLCQDQPATAKLAIMFALDHEMLIALHRINNRIRHVFNTLFTRQSVRLLVDSYQGLPQFTFSSEVGHYTRKIYAHRTAKRPTTGYLYCAS